MREIALDTETTGFEPSSGHRMVEIGCVEMKNKVRTGNVFHAYLNPERDMPEAAFKVHGLSTEFLRDQPLFKDVYQEFLEFIAGDKLVIHNAEFDMKFLNAELSLLKQEAIAFERAIDTLMIARKKFPGSPNSLDALCKRFNVDSGERTLHGALLDAELLADVYLELMGGAQTGLNFNQQKEAREVVERSVHIREARPHAASSQEAEAHRAFLEKIENPIWSN